MSVEYLEHMIDKRITSIMNINDVVDYNDEYYPKYIDYESEYEYEKGLIEYLKGYFSFICQTLLVEEGTSYSFDDFVEDTNNVLDWDF